MVKENRGQISLEYILIFAISLIILMVFTLPLAEQSINNTLDVSDTLEAKNCLSKIAQAIKQVYSEGQGSKHTVYLNVNKKVRVDISSGHVSCNLKLNDKSNKRLDEHVLSRIKDTSITLDKGENVLIVEWPVNGENMLIYKQ